MKVLIGVLVVLSATSTAAAADWKLVWSDEFDKPGLPDTAKWDYETGFLRNHEKQFYTRARPENARVENGILVIEARKEKFSASMLARKYDRAATLMPTKAIAMLTIHPPA